MADGFFNEIGSREGSLIWQIREALSEVCETRCKYNEEMRDAARKEAIAEEAGDYKTAEKYRQEWDALNEKYCETCPMYLITREA